MPHRKRYLLVCTNRRPDGHPKGSCGEKGGDELLRTLKASILKAGVSADVRACGATCLDMCELGMVVLDEPSHVAYGRVTVADADAMVEAIAAESVLERCVVAR